MANYGYFKARRQTFQLSDSANRHAFNYHFRCIIAREPRCIEKGLHFHHLLPACTRGEAPPIENINVVGRGPRILYIGGGEEEED